MNTQKVMDGFSNRISNAMRLPNVMDAANAVFGEPQSDKPGKAIIHSDVGLTIHITHETPEAAFGSAAYMAAILSARTTKHGRVAKHLKAHFAVLNALITVVNWKEAVQSKTRVCRHKQETIAGLACVSTRAVERSFKKLRELGILKKTASGWKLSVPSDPVLFEDPIESDEKPDRSGGSNPTLLPGEIRATRQKWRVQPDSSVGRHPTEVAGLPDRSGGFTAEKNPPLFSPPHTPPLITPRNSIHSIDDRRGETGQTELADGKIQSDTEGQTDAGDETTTEADEILKLLSERKIKEDAFEQILGFRRPIWMVRGWLDYADRKNIANPTGLLISMLSKGKEAPDAPISFHQKKQWILSERKKEQVHLRLERGMAASATAEEAKDQKKWDHEEGNIQSLREAGALEWAIEQAILRAPAGKINSAADRDISRRGYLRWMVANAATGILVSWYARKDSALVGAK